MKNVLQLCFAAAIILTPFAVVADPLKVVATTPDLADIARNIGGDRIEVTSLATGVEDPPTFAASPHCH